MEADHSLYNSVRITEAGRVLLRLNHSGDTNMNVVLRYSSGQQYMESFSKFDVRVSRDHSGTKRVRISMREKSELARGYSAFSLPPNKAKQLAYAILMACASDGTNVEFNVEEISARSAAA